MDAGIRIRIAASSTHAARWHLEKNRHGEPTIGIVKDFEKSHGITTSRYGAAYGGLSEVAHPARSAAVTISALHGDKSERIEQARDTITHDDAPGMMYLLIWTVFAEWPGMISLGITPDEARVKVRSQNLMQ